MIVTEAPAAPEAGDRLVIVGVAAQAINGVKTMAKMVSIREKVAAKQEVRFIQSPFNTVL